MFTYGYTFPFICRIPDMKYLSCFITQQSSLWWSGAPSSLAELGEFRAGTQGMWQCAGRQRLFSQSQLDQSLKTSALLEHLSLAWRGTDTLVSTNMATIVHAPSTIAMDTLRCRTIQQYNHPGRATVSDGRKQTSTHISPIRRLPGDSAPFNVINTAVTRGGKEVHSRRGERSARTNPHKRKIQQKNPKETIVWVRAQVPPWRSTC